MASNGQSLWGRLEPQWHLRFAAVSDVFYVCAARHQQHLGNPPVDELELERECRSDRRQLDSEQPNVHQKPEQLL
jgi:hypothetical protein